MQENLENFYSLRPILFELCKINYRGGVKLPPPPSRNRVKTHFQNLCIIHKPSLWSRDVTQKICSAVLTFIGYRHTNRQTSQIYIQIYVIYSWQQLDKMDWHFSRKPIDKIFFPGQRRALQLRLTAVSWCGCQGREKIRTLPK